MLFRTILCFLLVGVLGACSSDPQESWKPKNLLEYGIPISVNVPDPDSVIINKDDLGPFLDITVDGGEGYYLQIYASTAETTDVARLKANQLTMAKDQPYFSRIVEEEEAGFIFENQIDSTSSYGFRYILVKGDQEIVVRNHLSRLFTLPEIERMYKAVKPTEK